MIQSLQTSGNQWEELVLDEELEGEEELVEQIRRLHGLLRQELKDGEEEEIRAYLRKSGLRQEIIDALIRRADGMLHFYRAFSFLRDMEKENADILKSFLSIVYQKYIIRYEPGYIKQMASGKYDAEKLDGVVNRINYLTDFYVSRSYNMLGMMRDLQYETGLSKDSCVYWAELIDQNYQMLKMNFILEELKKINR